MQRAVLAPAVRLSTHPDYPDKKKSHYFIPDLLFSYKCVFLNSVNLNAFPHMLTLLKIRNLALVHELEWEPGPGLVGVTGETGAGKSVIVGAIKLVLGERAERGCIRSGEDQCSIEAVFHLADPGPVNDCLEQFGLDRCEDNTLVLRRVISATGTNRQFVNCSPVTLAVLKALGHHLVDLHGPHDHQSLLSRERQLAVLDAWAGNDPILRDYRAAYAHWHNLANELEEVSGSRRATEQEIDLLRHQVTEISAAELGDIDPEDLEERYRAATHGQRIATLCSGVLNLLDGSDENCQGSEEHDCVLNGLQAIERQLVELEKLDPRTADLLASLRSTHLELQEITSTVATYATHVELDPEALHALEERIQTIETLKRKYGPTIEEILAFHARAAARLQLVEGNTERLEELEAEVDAARCAMEKSGNILRKKRTAASRKLAREIASHLEDLGFRQSLFQIELSRAIAPLSSGLDEVEFRFAPNPGEPVQSLRQVASSGEMSRVMLAVKSALAREDAIPLLVFDEIDANVGGAIACSVGQKMVSLGSRHQVISITHLPQVAALADHHYHVAKQVENKRTISAIHPVMGEDRIDEIARMLGGSSDSAVAHAMSLLGRERCLEAAPAA